MIKTGTVFVGKSAEVTPQDLPSNKPADPITEEQIERQDQMQTEAITQLDNLAQDQNPVLMSLTTVFPFKFFPATVTIERTKVNVKDTIFFGSTDIKSVLISDISSVESESNIFFGTLRIIKRMPPEAPMLIKFLNKEDALQARRIIQGLMVALQNKVDVTKVSTAELTDSVERLGDSKAV